MFSALSASSRCARPRTVVRRATTFVGVVLALGAGVVHTPAAQAEPRSAETQFVSRVNTLRASHGLKPLRVDPMLTGVARDWASELAAKNCVCHHPEFETGNPDDAAAIVPGDWVKLGENVGTGSTVDQIQDAFEKSPGHRKNILDGAFDSVGIGVVEVNGVIWVSQEFQDLPSNEEARATRAAAGKRTEDAPDELALAVPKGSKPAKIQPRAGVESARKRSGKTAKSSDQSTAEGAPATSLGQRLSLR